MNVRSAAWRIALRDPDRSDASLRIKAVKSANPPPTIRASLECLTSDDDPIHPRLAFTAAPDERVEIVATVSRNPARNKLVVAANIADSRFWIRTVRAHEA